MTFNFPPGKVPVNNDTQPRLVEKGTGAMYILVRDDVAVTGKLYVAPIGMMTSMQSIRPDAFKERFDWYVEPSQRDIAQVVGGGPVDAPAKRAGRPRGSKDSKPRKKRATKRPTVRKKPEPEQVPQEATTEQTE